jgi:hypothetical protein
MQCLLLLLLCGTSCFLSSSHIIAMFVDATLIIAMHYYPS